MKLNNQTNKFYKKIKYSINKLYNIKNNYIFKIIKIYY